MAWTVALSERFEIRLGASSGLQSIYAAGQHHCNPAVTTATKMLAKLNEARALGAFYPRGHSHIDEYQIQHARGQNAVQQFKDQEVTSLCIVSLHSGDVGFAVFLEEGRFGKVLDLAEACLAHGLRMALNCEFAGFGGIEREFEGGEPLAIPVADIRLYRDSAD